MSSSFLRFCSLFWESGRFPDLVRIAFFRPSMRVDTCWRKSSFRSSGIRSITPLIATTSRFRRVPFLRDDCQCGSNTQEAVVSGRSSNLPAWSSAPLCSNAPLWSRAPLASSNQLWISVSGSRTVPVTVRMVLSRPVWLPCRSNVVSSTLDEDELEPLPRPESPTVELEELLSDPREEED